MSSVRTVVAVAVLLVAASSAATVASASALRDERDRAGGAVAGSLAPDEANASADPVVQTVTYNRTPTETGAIRATHRYEVGANTSALVVYDYDDAVVVGSEGFVEQSTGRWSWDGEADEPSLTFRLAVNHTGSEFDGLEWADTTDWSLTRPPRAFAYRTGASDGWVYSWRNAAAVEHRTRVERSGYRGGSVLYLGPHEVHERTTADQRLRLVRPRSTGDEPVDSERVLATLAAAARQLTVGARDETVNAFVGPDPLRHGGVTAASHDGSQDFWVAANRTVTAPANLWVHEYVHTRQDLSLGPSMAWFHEASATYYAGVLSVRQGIDGRSGFEAFVSRLRDNRTADAVLANRSSWSSPMVPYRKGMRALAALDAKIRNATDRNRTLQDVFRRLNAMNGTVTYDRFGDVVANVSETAIDGWLDAHVRGADRLSPPTDPWSYTSPNGSNDADGDGLTASTERRLGTHPFAADTDGDGLPDGLERDIGTDPRMPDTDRDRFDDGTELAAASDPVDPLSTPVRPATQSRLFDWRRAGIAVLDLPRASAVDAA